MTITSIVDVPKKASGPGSEDLFGISKYQNGLIKFVADADTPITIAIQGEWGSGKTSLMNSLQYSLCGDLNNIKEHDKEFYGIWVNTWQYSLMNSHEETLISIITSIASQVMKIISMRHEGTGQKIKSSVMNFIGKGSKAIAKLAADKIIEGGGDMVDMLVAHEKASQTIKDLREDLQSAILECLEKDNSEGKSKKGFLFFIDDLDRIDPPEAVEILELLKNIFDLEKCVFVLAIDYDVVVKGLTPKFGPLTDKNEREFRSFFDKIIQMPFSMPVASYSIDTFLIQSLQRIGYLNETRAKNKTLSEQLSSFCDLTVGSNPRSLKRLFNTVSLINIISNHEDSGDLSLEEDYLLLLNFALICIQIAYPSIYQALSREPDYISWDEDFARQLKLEELSDQLKGKLSDSEYFKEEWEQIVYRICHKEAYLSNRAVQISRLLNSMAGLIPADKEKKGIDLPSVLTQLLTLSSITHVQAFDKPKAIANKSPILKNFSQSLLPHLKNKLGTSWPTVRIQSRKVTHNVYVSFSPEKWEDCVRITIEPAENRTLLKISFHLCPPWDITRGFKVKTGVLDDDIKTAGLQKEFELLKNSLQKLLSEHKEISFCDPPMEKYGTRNGFYVVDLTLQINCLDVEEIMKKEKLEEIAEITISYMDRILKFKDLINKYNEKLK